MNIKVVDEPVESRELGAVDKVAADQSSPIAGLRVAKSAKPSSPWNSLEILKLVVGLAIAGGVAGSGFLVTRHFRQQDAIKERRVAAQEFSKAIFARITRSVMLYKSLQRQSASLHPSYEEVERRKRDYDDAFFHFHTNVGGYIVTLRTISVSATPGGDYKTPSLLENYLQHSLVESMFDPIHECLASSYIDFLQEKGSAMPKLEACEMNAQLNRAIQCSRAMTEQVHLLVDSLVAWPDADQAIKKSCPPPSKQPGK